MRDLFLKQPFFLRQQFDLRVIHNRSLRTGQIIPGVKAGDPECGRPASVGSTKFERSTVKNWPSDVSPAPSASRSRYRFTTRAKPKRSQSQPLWFLTVHIPTLSPPQDSSDSESR